MMVYYLFELLFCLSETWILFDFNYITDSQEKKRPYYHLLPFILLTSCLVLYLNSYSLYSASTPFLLSLIISCICHFYFKIPSVHTVTVSLSAMVAVGIMDSIVPVLLGILLKNASLYPDLGNTFSVWRISVVLIIKTLDITLYLFIRRKLIPLHFSAKKLLLMALAGYLGLIFFLDSSAVHYPTWIMFITVISLLTLALYYHTRTSQEKMNAEILLLRNEMLEENYKTMEHLYAENAKLYHDLNNHLTLLYQLLDEDSSRKEAQDYILSISQPLKQLQHIKWTGLSYIDIIINTKADQARQHNITLDADTEFPPNTTIASADVCTILANLLDNAVEACLHVPDSSHRFIRLSIRRINNFILIKTINPYNPAQLVRTPSGLQSIKGNKKLHGWGLKSVESAARKYLGTLKLVPADTVFTASVILFYTKTEQDDN